MDSLIPRPFFEGRRRKGLVHTDCACAHLYPESGYILYTRKIILSKLIIYNGVSSSYIVPALSEQEHEIKRKEFVRAVDRQATSKTRI